MKSLSLIIFSICVCLQSKGQLRQGQFLLGGNAGFRHEQNNERSQAKYKSNVFTISPMLGVLVLKKLAAGLSFSYEHHRTIALSSNQSSFKLSSFAYSPFVRYYILNERKSFNVLTQLSYHYIHYTQQPENGAKLADGDDGFSGSAGPVIFLSPQLGLEFNVGYKTAQRPFDLGKEKTVFSSVGFQVHL